MNASLPTERLIAAWTEVVDRFRETPSAERRALDPRLAAAVRLSPEGLDAGLEAVLGGVAGECVAEVFRAAAARRMAASRTARPRPPVLVVLAGNVPGLAVQPLLPALALGRRVVLKSSSAEPFFAPAFVAALADREPAVSDLVTATTWRGGDEAVEAPLLAECDPVLAYGDAPAIAALERRAAGRVIAYGPKTSLAVVGPEADPGAVAPGLARDVALFDQRGCLSIAAVYVAGNERRAEAVAAALAAELERLAEEWPPGPATAGEQASVRQACDEAVMAGARLLPIDPAAGRLILDRRPAFRAAPGRRTVRLHPLGDLATLLRALAPWAGRLQGLAVAGLAPADERRLVADLRPLGLSRFATPGRLQHPDTRWQNGGVDPLDVLA